MREARHEEGLHTLPVVRIEDFVAPVTTHDQYADALAGIGARNVIPGRERASACMDCRNESGVDIRAGIGDLGFRKCGRYKDTGAKPNLTIAADCGAGFQYGRKEERIAEQMPPNVDRDPLTDKRVSPPGWLYR